jgi:hypothetical protein
MSPRVKNRPYWNVGVAVIEIALLPGPWIANMTNTMVLMEYS